jgi:hypothetical protein
LIFRKQNLTLKTLSLRVWQKANMDRDNLDDLTFPNADPIDSGDEGEFMSAAEIHYNNNGYVMKTIVAMAMGLKQEDEPTAILVDTTKDPWLTKVPKKTW